MNLNDLRKSLNSFGSELRDRRLLPVLALIIAVAVAIPLLLSHSGKASALSPLPPAPAVTAPDPTAAAPQPVRHPVSLRRHRLSLPAHNPFVKVQTKSSGAAGAGTRGVKAAGETITTTPGGATATIAPTQGRTSTTSTGSSSQRPATSGRNKTKATAPSHSLAVAHTVTVSAPPVTHTVTETTTTKPAPTPDDRYTDYQVQAAVRQVGVAGPTRVYHNLARYQFVPSDNSAFASFLGVRPDRRTAVFVIGKGETVTGQGECAPSAATCTFLMLTPGQMADVTVPTGDSFTLMDLAVHKVMSSASVVDVDATGRSVVTTAEHYVEGLRSLRFDRYTGLLYLDIGSTAPVSH